MTVLSFLCLLCYVYFFRTEVRVEREMAHAEVMESLFVNPQGNKKNR